MDIKINIIHRTVTETTLVPVRNRSRESLMIRKLRRNAET